MFADASAIIAIIAQEAGWEGLAGQMRSAEQVYVSPLSIWEAVAGLARQSSCPPEEAEELVQEFVRTVGGEIVAVTGDIGREAVAAYARYGKGRHKAALNFGDCFAYACAKMLDVPLLYKGEDFLHTDLA